MKMFNAKRRPFRIGANDNRARLSLFSIQIRDFKGDISSSRPWANVSFTRCRIMERFLGNNVERESLLPLPPALADKMTHKHPNSQ